MSDPTGSPSPAGSPATAQAELAACVEALAALRDEQAVFAHGISHDLRAPLRSIDSFVALLARNESLDATARDHLERVRAASARMGGLIDALLELSRANRAELAPATVDLGLLVELELAARQDAEPGITLDAQVAPGLLVHGDERLLRQLVATLLDNTWKFSRASGCVHVRVDGVREGDRLHLRVQDQGCGFDMRYAAKLFAPFQRLHGPDEGGGHGLGLAVAQRIVARHAGRIRAESRPGAGATFHLDLPAADADDAGGSNG
jgi:signal transduction histidine kinase